MVSALGVTNGTTKSNAISGAITAAQQRAGISRDQFLQILVKELSSQNPLDPVDNNQFMQQLVGLQSLEQTAALTDSLRTFQRFMQMSSGAGLIGKTVKGVASDGSMVNGVVNRVVVEGEKVQLMIGTHKMSVDAVQEIVAPAA